MQNETTEDFIFLGEDFSDAIKTEKDRNKFDRMRELEKELHKPAAECLDAVLEIDQLRNELLGLPQRTIIKLDVGKAYKNPSLN